MLFSSPSSLPSIPPGKQTTLNSSVLLPLQGEKRSRWWTSSWNSSRRSPFVSVARRIPNARRCLQKDALLLPTWTRSRRVFCPRPSSSSIPVSSLSQEKAAGSQEARDLSLTVLSHLAFLRPSLVLPKVLDLFVSRREEEGRSRVYSSLAALDQPSRLIHALDALQRVLFVLVSNRDLYETSPTKEDWASLFDKVR